MYLWASYSFSDIKIIFQNSSIFQMRRLTNQRCFPFIVKVENIDQYFSYVKSQITKFQATKSKNGI